MLCVCTCQLRICQGAPKTVRAAYKGNNDGEGYFYRRKVVWVLPTRSTRFRREIAEIRTAIEPPLQAFSFFAKVKRRRGRQYGRLMTSNGVCKNVLVEIYEKKKPKKRVKSIRRKNTKRATDVYV